MTLSEGQRNNHVEDQLVMPCWYFEKEDLRNTPSIQDGLEFATEQRYRQEGSKFIIDCGAKLGLRYDTCATGVVFFHRFYMFHSFRSFPRYVTAACCLFLAGKIEETPKKCRDIVKTARSQVTDHQFSQFGQDPREEVMALERVLLKTIKFDLQIDHPYRHLLQYGKKILGDKEKIQALVQMAWTFTNDSLNTTLCLQWEPEIVACALLYLATKLSRREIENWENKDRSPASAGQKWWEHFVPGMSLEVMEDICHQILDLYSNPLSSRNVSEPPAGVPGGPSSVPGPSGPEPGSRRKRKSDSRSGAGESVGTQAGGSRSGKVRPSSGSSVPAISAPQMPPASFASQVQMLGASSSSAAAGPPPGYTAPADTSQYAMQYAMFSRQQQAAAAAVAAVYATSGTAPGVYPPPQHGAYPGQSLPQGHMPIASTNPPVRIPTKGTSSTSGSNSGAFNPAVRITRGQRR